MESAYARLVRLAKATEDTLGELDKAMYETAVGSLISDNTVREYGALGLILANLEIGMQGVLHVYTQLSTGRNLGTNDLPYRDETIC